MLASDLARSASRGPPHLDDPLPKLFLPQLIRLLLLGLFSLLGLEGAKKGKGWSVGVSRVKKEPSPICYPVKETSVPSVKRRSSSSASARRYVWRATGAVCFFCLGDRYQPYCLLHGLRMRWRMCYVSVSRVFLHRGSSFCSCFGIVTAVESHAAIRMVTCYDLALVFPDPHLDGNDREKHFGSGCPWNGVFVVVGSWNETGSVCLSQRKAISPAFAYQQSGFETRSSADAWARASLCRRKASVCGRVGSCSREGVKIAISCARRGGTDVDRHHDWTNAIGNESANGNGLDLSRGSGLVICAVGRRVGQGDGRQECKNHGHVLRLGRSRDHHVD